jgi:serralysin
MARIEVKITANSILGSAETDFGGITEEIAGSYPGAPVSYTHLFNNDDTLTGRVGTDLIVGDIATNDGMQTFGSDTIYGGAGGDFLYGDADKYAKTNYSGLVSTASNTLYGEAGNDVVYGGAGNDFLYGGNDNDVLVADKGNDVINGGSHTWLHGIGGDYISFMQIGRGVRADLAKTVQQDTLGAGLDTIVGIENVRGSSYNDAFYGTTGANVLRSGKGNDIIDGRAGNDILQAEEGNDTLRGGDGNDDLSGGDGTDNLNGGNGNDILSGDGGKSFMTGGAGRDRFKLGPTATKSAATEITDFRPADDTMAFSQLTFFKIGRTLDKNEFYIGSTAHDADDRLIYNKATGWLTYDLDGNGSRAAYYVALLDKGLSLTTGDFLIL